MNFSFLASLLIFIILLGNLIRRSRRKSKKTEESFWEKERRANSVRKKSLAGLEYLEIPEDFYHFYEEPYPEIVASVLQDLAAIGDGKIVNLTGISNTDLKLTYGTANLTVLTQYDQNYTIMVRQLQKLAEYLIEDHRKKDATRVLEFLIDSRTDVSASYRILADLYLENNTPEKIAHLIEIADTLNSAMRKPIIDSLHEKENGTE